MAKEAEEESAGFFSEILKTVKEVLASNIKESIREKARKVKKRFVREVFGFILFVLGLALAIVSVVLLVNYYLQLNLGWSFLLVGILLMLISMIVKYKGD